MNHSRHYQLLPFVIYVIIITGLLIYSCRRIQHEDLPEVKVNTIKEKFFDVPATVDPIIKALAEKIRRQNDQYNFVDELVKRVGFPKWDKSLIVTNYWYMAWKGLQQSQPWVNVWPNFNTYPNANWDVVTNPSMSDNNKNGFKYALTSDRIINIHNALLSEQTSSASARGKKPVGQGATGCYQ